MTLAKRLFSVRDSPFSCKDLTLCLSAFICGCVFFFAAPVASAKEKADLVVTNAIVITMDPARRVIENGAVAMRGDSILAVDSSETISARYDAGKIIDARAALVLPALPFRKPRTSTFSSLVLVRVLRFRHLFNSRRRLACSAAQPRRISTPHLPSIEFA
jgi:hypothetical protein